MSNEMRKLIEAVAPLFENNNQKVACMSIMTEGKVVLTLGN